MRSLAKSASANLTPPPPTKYNQIPMNNPLAYIRNKFCVWITGLSVSEISVIQEQCQTLGEEKYISKDDFDPDDYDFQPLRDYDFSEFLTNENVDEQIECYLNNNDYATCDFVTDCISEELDNYITKEDLIERLDDYRKRIAKLEVELEQVKNK